MTTRLELRTAVRRRLEDTGGSPLWDDAALNDFLAEAMRRYGVRFPKELSTTVNVVAGATSAVVTPALTAGQVVRIFDDVGQPIPRQQAIEPDAALSGLVTAQAWRWWGSTLVLAQPAAATATWQIDYLGGRTLPTDDVTAVDVDDGDEDIVVLLAAATALRRRAIEDGKRGAGRGAGNGPIAVSADVCRNEAERLIAARRRRARGGWTATG
ncbi:MAG TPA: hypothetical protein VH482_27335 [Thermomicrobiales bacterium]|jgi:hypothetical protein